ncbi:MAG: hypothetical protein J5494_01430, partial [Candidatus Methanomethylophilaceae archaeon]|nr:hypothetical protein [Candidatus Methanomethylophilaceae archaeon]
VPGTYSFYASGLPSGLGVRVVNGDGYEFAITGKAEYNIDIDEELGYALYPLTITAVDLDGNILEPPVNINLRVYYSESDFSYEVVELDPSGEEIPDQDHTPVHGDSSKIIKGGDSIQIKTLKTDGETSNPGVKAYVQIIDDEGKAVEKELDKDKDGNYVYGSEADDSGVVEIYLKGPAVGSTQITHKLTVLVVGEVVHSGLDPRVTSS